MSEKEIDHVSGVETTGHEWDGIKELNNPLPRWWLWTFYATIIFSIGYMIYYPSIPLWETSTMGISGETNRLRLQRTMEAVAEQQGELIARIEASDLADIRSDETLFRFAAAGGESLFKVYCSQCHGSGAQGGPGYPNLNDDEWLWGGDLDAIYTTILHGIRADKNMDTRLSQMPAFGAILETAQISAITEYVLQVSGKEHDAAKAGEGASLFADNCAACHGETAQGNRELGAPNLTDAIALYAGSREAIKAQISQPKHGVMPAWAPVLREANIKQLAIFVHSLGGGETVVQPK